MAESAQERQEAQLKANAEKALEELPDEHKEEAAAARTQLLNWLVTMNRLCQTPEEMATDALANTACNALEHAVNAQVEKAPKAERAKWIALQEALQGLSDTNQLDLMQFLIGAVFKVHAKNAALMTRAHDLFLWENTGFHSDGDLKCVFAKVGRNPYQAIGFDDGEHYIGTEGSKTLWTREFCLALLLPFAPAFEVTREELEPQKVSDDTRLSDKERAKIEEAIAMFDKDLADHAKAKGKKAIAEMEDRMREGIKLIRIRVPRLDNKLDEFQDENPDVGQHFENIDIVQLLVSCREFLQMKLDDDGVRRDVAATVLSVGNLAEEQARLIDTLLSGLGSKIPPEGEAPDVEALNTAITEAVTAFPELREVLKDFEGEKDILEAAEAVMLWLQKRLG